MSLSFGLVDQESYKVVLAWLTKPHVALYFHGDGLRNTLIGLEKSLSADGSLYQHWIASKDGVPFAYLMTSEITPLDPECDRFVRHMKIGERAITLDLLIGEEEFLGRGLAVEMIISFLVEKFSHATKVFIDPGVANAKAVHVYEKAGFKKLEQFVAEWHPVPHWLMSLEIAALVESRRLQ